MEKYYKVISLAGNTTGSHFRIGGLKEGDIVTQEEVNRYCLNCDCEFVSVEEFNSQFNTKIEEINKFTKDMLKTGMVVETRDGIRYMVVLNRFVRENRWSEIEFYNDDLTYGKFGDGVESDIMKIYDIPKLTGFDDLNGATLNEWYKSNLIWQREEAPEKSEAQLEIEKMKAEKAEYDKQWNERIAELEKKL